MRPVEVHRRGSSLIKSGNALGTIPSKVIFGGVLELSGRKNGSITSTISVTAVIFSRALVIGLI